MIRRDTRGAKGRPFALAMSVVITKTPFTARENLSYRAASTSRLARVVNTRATSKHDDNRIPDRSTSIGTDRRTALLSSSFSVASLAILSAAAPRPAAAAGKQPIDWLFEETFGNAVSLGDSVRDSLAESGVTVKKKPVNESARTVEGVEGERNYDYGRGDTDGGEGGGGVGLNLSTAAKFGKLGAILVFADVVTFFLMGRSVLGIMDDGGEEGWKAKVADKIMERANLREQAAVTMTTVEDDDEGSERGEDNARPPAA
jgi:hypothetical protein